MTWIFFNLAIYKDNHLPIIQLKDPNLDLHFGQCILPCSDCVTDGIQARGSTKYVSEHNVIVSLSWADHFLSVHIGFSFGTWGNKFDADATMRLKAHLTSHRFLQQHGKVNNYHSGAIWKPQKEVQ
jgi:hypothetical protein